MQVRMAILQTEGILREQMYSLHMSHTILVLNFATFLLNNNVIRNRHFHVNHCFVITTLPHTHKCRMLGKVCHYISSLNTGNIIACLMTYSNSYK